MLLLLDYWENVSIRNKLKNQNQVRFGHSPRSRRSMKVETSLDTVYDLPCGFLKLSMTSYIEMTTITK